jgi:hypothetical protein
MREEMRREKGKTMPVPNRVVRRNPIIDYLADNYMGNAGMAVVAPKLNRMLDMGIDVTPQMVDFMFDEARNDWVTKNLTARAEMRAKRAEGKKGTSYVYFLQNGDRIKIGFSRNPQARAQALSLRESNILGVIEAGQRFERILHDNWAHIRIDNTEWFHATPELLSFIKSSAVKWHYRHPSKKEIEPQTVEESYLKLYQAIKGTI